MLRALATWNDKGQPKERPEAQNQNDHTNNGTAIDFVLDASANLLMTIWASSGAGFTEG
jgi:hypothetical protein